MNLFKTVLIMYVKLYKIHPVLHMVWDSFAETYKPGQNQTINEGITAFKGRLTYVQYLPTSQSGEKLRCGIAVILILHIYIN